MEEKIIEHIPQASPQAIYYKRGQVIRNKETGKIYRLTENGWQLIEEKKENAETNL